MKQKARRPGQKQTESCGVWLDTSALKKRKIQSFMAKPVLRTLNQLSHCPLATKAPLQCTKQTTISTFFSTQAEEKKTNPNRNLAVALKRASKMNNHGLFGGGKNKLSANRLPERGGQAQQGLHISPCNSTSPEAQTTTCILPTETRDSAAERDDPQLLNFIQLQEKKRDPEHRTLSDLALKEENSGWERKKHTTLFPQSSQSLTVTDKPPRRHRRPPSYYSPSCDTENINPQLEQSTREVKPLKRSNQSVAGLCLKSNSNEGIEDSQVDLVSLPMFTQDSDGHKVISHLFVQERGKTSLQKRFLCDESSSIMSPSYDGCLGACFSTERGTHLAPGGSMSAVTDSSSEKSCYDLLFTEDSEGNRVIKH